MLVLDTGPIVAAAASRDRHHEACAALLTTAPPPLVVPALVVTEVSYFLLRELGPAAERAFASSIGDGGLVVEPVEQADWRRICVLLDTYADMPLGIVDASIVALCERLGETRLATLDRRHLGTVRPLHCEALELLPG